MTSFQNMLHWLRSGKKVRRPNWDDGCYLWLKPNQTIVNDRNEKVKFDNINSLEKEDYEIFEEDSLSDWIAEEDSIRAFLGRSKNKWISEQKVKEAVRKLKREIRSSHDYYGKEILNKIDKAFGNRLT